MTQVRRPPEQCQNETSFFERLNYFFGKLLKVQDFRQEQRYFNEKRWKLNRFGIGWGVLHGLDVHYKGEGCITISPGFALDKYGHEIWVAQKHTINLKKCLAEAGIEAPSDSPRPGTCYYVYLTYAECYTEPSPVTVEECGHLETDCCYGRVRETYRFKVLDTAQQGSEPELPIDPSGCKIDCSRFLHDPAARIVKNQPEQAQCVDIPLAQLCWEEDCGKWGWHIDTSPPSRKLAFSNRTLYDLTECLKQEVWKVHEARFDRKRFVPLLAQTIKDVHQADGKIGTLTMYRRHPTRLTTDGDYIWVTDQDTCEIFRVHRDADVSRPFHEVVEKPRVYLAKRNWGLAYADDYIWVTHFQAHEDAVGVTGIHVCDLTNREKDRSIEGMKAEPREIVFTGEYLVVSHGLREAEPKEETSTEEQQPRQEYNDANHTEGEYPENGNVQWITVIDPKKCTIVKIHPIPVDRWTTSEIRSMAYDGDAIWAVSHSTNGYGLRKISIHNEDPSEENSSGLRIEVSGPYDCNGDQAEDVAFDGTHIWVASNEGVTKIDINTGKDIANALQREDQTAVAYDGMHLWTGEPAQGIVNRVDPFVAGAVGGPEIRGERHPSYRMSRICFDGTYLWVAACESYEAEEEAYKADEIDEQASEAARKAYKDALDACDESEEPDHAKGFKKGLLHRLIP